MIRRADVDLGVDLRKSVVVGAACSDLEARHRAGCRMVLVLTGYGATTLAGVDNPSLAAAGRGEAVAWILDQWGQGE